MNVNVEQTHPLTEGRRRKAEGIKDNYECKRRAGGSAERAKSSTFRLYNHSADRLTCTIILTSILSRAFCAQSNHKHRSVLVHSQPAQSAFFSFKSEHLLLPFIAHSSIIAGKLPLAKTLNMKTSISSASLPPSIPAARSAILPTSPFPLCHRPTVSNLTSLRSTFRSNASCLLISSFLR